MQLAAHVEIEGRFDAEGHFGRKRGLTAKQVRQRRQVRALERRETSLRPSAFAQLWPQPHPECSEEHGNNAPT